LNLQIKVQREEVAYLNVGSKVLYDSINTDIITQHALDEMLASPFVGENWNAIKLNWNSNIEFEKANIKIKTADYTSYFYPFYRYLQKFNKRYLLLYVPYQAKYVDIEVIGFDNSKNTLTRYLIYNVPVKNNVTRGPLNQEMVCSNINFEIRSDRYKGYKKFSQERNLENKIITPEETLKFYYDVDGIKKEPVHAYMILKNLHHTYKINLPILFEKNFGSLEKFYSLIRVPSEFKFVSIFLEYINNETGENEVYKDTFKIGSGVFIPEEPTAINLYSRVLYTVGAEIVTTNIYTKIKRINTNDIILPYPTTLQQFQNVLWELPVVFPELNLLNPYTYLKKEDISYKSIRYGAHNMDKAPYTKLINIYSRRLGYMSSSAIIRFYPQTDLLTSDDINLIITTYYGEYEIKGKWKTQSGSTLKYFDFEIWDDVTRVNISYSALVPNAETGTLEAQTITELFNVSNLWGKTDRFSSVATIQAKKISPEYSTTNAFARLLSTHVSHSIAYSFVDDARSTMIIIQPMVKIFQSTTLYINSLVYLMPSLYNTVYYNIPSSFETSMINMNLMAVIQEYFGHIPNLKAKRELLNSIYFKNFTSLKDEKNINFNVYVSNVRSKQIDFSHLISGYTGQKYIYAFNLTYITSIKKRLKKRNILPFNNFTYIFKESEAIPYDPIAIFKEQYPWLASYEFNRATTKSFKNLVNDVLLLESTTLYGTILVSYSSQEQTVVVRGKSYNLKGGEKIIFPFLIPPEDIVGNVFNILDKINGDWITINAHGMFNIQYSKFQYVFRNKYSKEQLEYAIAHETPLPQKYWGELQDYIVGLD